MNDSTIKALQAENRHLRCLVTSLSITLLRKVAVKSAKDRAANTADAERWADEAEECFRCARIPGLKSEIAEGLEVAGHELMAKAVEIETALQRAKRQK
jgi:hypothetical protein